MIELKVGEAYTLKDLAEFFNISYSTIRKQGAKEKYLKQLKQFAEFKEEKKKFIILEVKKGKNFSYKERLLELIKDSPYMKKLPGQYGTCSNFAEDTIEEINQLREEYGLKPLVSSTLAKYYSQASKEIFGNRIHSTKYKGGKAAIKAVLVREKKTGILREPSEEEWQTIQQLLADWTKGMSIMQLNDHLTDICRRSSSIKEMSAEEYFNEHPLREDFFTSVVKALDKEYGLTLITNGTTWVSEENAVSPKEAEFDM